jgi:uncharacterized protein (TIGR03663 family)
MAEQQMAAVAVTRREQFIGLAVFVVALLLGAWLRFDRIGIKPFHHDEGVNSYFLLNLAHHGQYAYNPENYHGPTLYYLALGALSLLGETDLALRFWPAAFGVMSIGVLWWLRRELGTMGLAAAAMLIAFSPGLVYFSRDFIHEMSFGFFSLAIVAAVWRYSATKSFAALAAAAAAAGMLFATKETAVITIIVLGLAALCAGAWDISRRLLRARGFGVIAVIRELLRDLRGLLPGRDQLIAALAIFIVIDVLFYSSFFMNMRGVLDAYNSVVLWSRRSGTEHVHVFGYYFGILSKLELPLIIGALIGCPFILWRGSRFGLFVLAWSAGIFLAYSLIPYKTPWLLVNLLIPLGLTSGYAAGEIYRVLPPISPRLLWALVCLLAFILSWQMAWRVNFEFYDDNDNRSGYLTRLGSRLEWRPYTDTQYGYVYAQTDRELLQLVRAVDDAVGRLPTREKTGIYVASPAYWPLPWYLRRYDGVAYTGDLPDAVTRPEGVTQPLLIANVTQQAAVEKMQGWRAATSPIALRPGEKLILYVRAQE